MEGLLLSAFFWVTSLLLTLLPWILSCEALSVAKMQVEMGAQVLILTWMMACWWSKCNDQILQLHCFRAWHCQGCTWASIHQGEFTRAACVHWLCHFSLGSVISYTGVLLNCVESPVVSDCLCPQIMAAFQYKPDFREKDVTVVRLFAGPLELVTRIIEFPLMSE